MLRRLWLAACMSCILMVHPGSTGNASPRCLEDQWSIHLVEVKVLSMGEDRDEATEVGLWTDTANLTYHSLILDGAVESFALACTDSGEAEGDLEGR